MRTSPVRSRVVARFGVLGVALVMGLALVASTLQGYLAARGHAAMLIDEQVRGLLNGLARELVPARGAPSAKELERALAAHADQGLRYLALFDADGKIVASAGEARAGSPTLPPPGKPVQVAGRVRLVAPPPGPPGAGPGRPPPPFDEAAPPDAPFAPGPPAPPPPPPGADSLRLVLELEPVLAEQFVADARRTLLVGISTALLLGAAAVVLFRAWVERDARERDLLRQRHLATLGEMSGVLAHEIRNPLAVAKGHAQLLAEKVGDDERQARWVGQVIESLERLEGLTSDLLELAKSGEITRASCSPRELVEAAIADLSDERIRIDADGAPAAWPLDARHLRTVISNLVQNALQASPEGKPVEIGVFAERDQLVLTVRDHGSGIPAGDEERIFEAFHTTKTRGAGLGLAIARRIVELHAGRIEAASHPEGGAVFRVTLPGA